MTAKIGDRMVTSATLTPTVPVEVHPRPASAAPGSSGCLRRVAVEIEGVTKTFGGHAAVNNLSLRVPERSICGFIGPNGSGKTTTLRLIMRIYYPDQGSGCIRVLGRE